MKSIVNFLLFQLGWFAAVWGAGRGWMWLGPAVFALVCGAHLALVRERWRELGYLVLVGAVGALLDTGLAAVGATIYPSSAAHWPHAVVPPWIVSLWVGFATLPRFSLAWLARWPALAFLFGAVGGPLSYLAGTRFGAVGVGEEPLLTWGLLAVEYGVITPLLLRLAPGVAHKNKVAAE